VAGKNSLFADVAMTFFLPRQQKSQQRGGKTKFFNIARGHSQIFLCKDKAKHAYIARGKSSFTH
jgi:hypothetical protein